MLPHKIELYGLASSLKEKLYTGVKPVPSVLILNSVPRAKLPPLSAVPYRVLPNKTKPDSGCAPSLFGLEGEAVAVKICMFVKPVPSVLTLNNVPLPELPPLVAAPYRVLLDNINCGCG